MKGHVSELVRPLGTIGVPCPVCGAAAIKSEVHHIDVVGPTVDTRGQFKRMMEASSEIDHAYTKVEQDRGVKLQSPSIYSQAKQKAHAMISAGEADSFKIRS